MGSADYAISHSLDVDGHLDLDVSWNPDEVFDCLRVGSVAESVKRFSVAGRLPNVTKDSIAALRVGKFSLDCFESLWKNGLDKFSK